MGSQSECSKRSPHCYFMPSSARSRNDSGILMPTSLKLTTDVLTV